MKKNCDPCPFERVQNMQYRHVSEDLREVKDRVQRLETGLARGVMLLVANLVGVIITLAERFLG